MGGRKGRSWRRALLLAATLGLAGGAGSAQEELPGSDLRLDFATGLLVTDNLEGLPDPEGTSTLWRNVLGLNFSSFTRSQRLEFDAGLTLQAGRFADQITAREIEQTPIQSPFVSVDYALENRNTLLAFRGSFRQRDNGLEEIDFVDAESLVIDQGTRSDLNLDARLELGRQAPLSLTLAAAYSERRFFDTTDIALTDRDVLRLEARLGLRLSRATRLSFESFYRESQDEDFRETFEVNRTVRLGLDHRTRGGLAVRLTAGYQFDEITRTFGPSRPTFREEEPVVTFGLTQDVRTGDFSFDLTQRVEATGARTDLLFGRTLTLPRAEIRARFGASFGEDDEVTGIGSLDYVQDLRRGRLSVRFDQGVRTVDAIDEVFTSARVDYRHTLTQLSSVVFAMELAATDQLRDNGVDDQRANASLIFVRSLDRDWDFNVGYRYSTFEETGQDSIIENAVFANVSRSFDLRP